MKKRPVKSTNRLVNKKKRRSTIDPVTRQLILRILGGLAVFTVVLLVLTGVWYGSRVDNLTIETITVEGGQTISHTQVRDAVGGTLEGSYFGLIPKRFAWTYPEDTAMAAAANISRVKNPTVVRVSGTELLVSIDEYLPFALWCTEESMHSCYFIDKEGVAFAPAPILDGGSMYRFYTLGTEPALNKVLKDKTTLSEVVKVADALEEDFDLPVTKIELDLVGDIFLHVVGGGEIKITTKQSATKILENLTLVLSADDFKLLKAGTFLYIDLRFGNKVFVNDTLPTIAVATTTDEFATSSNDIPEEKISILNTIVEEVTRAVSVDQEDEEVEVEGEISDN